jgi:hypothetical protein
MRRAPGNLLNVYPMEIDHETRCGGEGGNDDTSLATFPWACRSCNGDISNIGRSSMDACPDFRPFTNKADLLFALKGPHRANQLRSCSIEFGALDLAFLVIALATAAALQRGFSWRRKIGARFKVG